MMRDYVQMLVMSILKDLNILYKKIGNFIIAKNLNNDACEKIA
jgi:hypothetical protein